MEERAIFDEVIKKRESIVQVNEDMRIWKTNNSDGEKNIIEQETRLTALKERHYLESAEHSRNWDSWDPSTGALALISFLWSTKFPALFSRSEASSTALQAAKINMAASSEFTRNEWESALASNQKMSAFITKDIALQEMIDTIETLPGVIAKLKEELQEGKTAYDRHLEEMSNDTIELDKLLENWKIKYGKFQDERVKSTGESTDNVNDERKDKKASVSGTPKKDQVVSHTSAENKSVPDTTKNNPTPTTSSRNYENQRGAKENLASSALSDSMSRMQLARLRSLDGKEGIGSVAKCE